MISLTTPMCHFEVYGYSNSTNENRPPFLLGFSEQALSSIPPNVCMGSTLYATGDRQVLSGLTCVFLRVHKLRTSRSARESNQGRTNLSGWRVD